MSLDERTPMVEALERYRPADIDDADWQVVRPALLGLVGPHVTSDMPVARVRRYTSSAAAFLRWLHGGGHQVSHADELLVPPLVEGFLAQHLRDKPEHTRATYRSTLRDLGRLCDPSAWSQESERKVLVPPKPPYTDDEVRRLIIAARSISPAPMRARVQSVIFAGLGAGLDTKDFRVVRAADVRCAEDGTIEVHIGPPRRREVPVLDRYADQLYGAAQQVETTYLVGDNIEARNLYGHIIRLLSRFDAPHLLVSRLRATWIVEQLTRGVAHYDLINAAGLRNPHWISRYAVYVPSGQSHARDQLRGL